MKKYIAVAGNIGVGKSTLVKLLTERLDWQPFYEPVGENPYLADFYANMTTWSFHSQVFFLSQRLRIHRELLSYPVPSSRTAASMKMPRCLPVTCTCRATSPCGDYETYYALYQNLSDFLTPPDLMIYLRSSVDTLTQRILQRNRDYERTISTAYLEQLNTLYEKWIASFVLCPVLTIPADDLDYVAHPSHMDLVVRKVQDKLTGKEEVVFNPEEVTGRGD